ncbi:ATP-binding protein [Actinoplanes sp. HUAS TT8]|uniref:PAS domain-containing sensor histidine kinase n=1 Tax=Actinoplanes sp. HUAS TT8 TaxID=3447453 RepID=UPI003F51B039
MTVNGMVAGPAWTASLNSAALLDSVQEAFLAVDATGVVRGVNRSAQELLGFSAEELCDRHLDDTLRPEHDGPTAPALARLFASAPQRPVGREIRVRHRDGHLLAVRATVSVIPSTGGPVACMFLTDLSGQADAEQRAERNDSFLSALLESLSVGVTACDDAGRLVVLNRAARTDLGLLPDGPIPQPAAITAGAVLRDGSLTPLAWDETPLARACRGEHVGETDVVVEVPGRSARTFATTARPIPGTDQSRAGAVSVAQDVTAVRRLERFRSCQDTIDQILAGSTSITEVTPVVLRAVAETLGWPGAELFLLDEGVGALRSVGHWGSAEEIFGHQPIYGQALTGRVWATGQPILVPDITLRRDRSTGYERERMEACLRNGVRTALAVPVRDGGTLLGVLTCYAAAPELHEDQLVVLLSGVAAQIGAYVALRRSEQLARQLSQVQEDFINLVGHELRTPLTSITANARMLAEDAGLLDEEHQQMVTAIDRNAAILQSIVDALLDLAHLEAGHTEIQMGIVDLVAIVADAITVARHTAADAGVRLVAELPARLTMAGEAVRLRQVVDDVVANAITYSRPGEPVRITLTADPTTIHLCVTDLGIGVPAGEHGRVFDRFYRGSNVRHHGIAGHGLGLSLARAIVHLHHGTISLSDNAPSGTVVCVSFPLYDRPGA